MSTRISLGLVFLGSIFSSVVVAACATDVVSSSTELRKAGAACGFQKQCASGRCSVDDHHVECGFCLDERKLGESCVGLDQSCTRSAVCEKGICQTHRSVLGESCIVGGKGGDPCDDDFYCNSPPGEQGTCVAPVAVGGSCELSSRCVKGAYCDESGVCAIPPADSCVLRPCGAGSFCDAHKTCRVATLRAGERCGIVDGGSVDNGCELGTACGNTTSPGVGGGPKSIDTCLPLPGAGENCFLGQCTVGLFCAQQTLNRISGLIPSRCEALREEGDRCSPDTWANIDCGAGLECWLRVCERACD